MACPHGAGALKGKVCIITGSSTGFGAVTAVRFAAEKAEAIVLHGRQEDKLQAVKKQCVEQGLAEKNVLIVVGDITSQAVQEKLIGETVKTFGHLDVLVNNAGIYLLNNVENGSMETFDQLWNVNVRSLVALTKLAIPHLVASKGCVVNISSGLAKKATSFSTFYSMGKAAVDHFTRCLALELAPKGVRVNSVNPGYIPGTDISVRHGATKDQLSMVYDMSLKHHPMGKLGTPEDVAEAITWIAGRASNTTGHTLFVDGGFHIN